MTPIPKRFLITGASGLLGRALEKEATRRGLDVIPLGRDDLDITDLQDTPNRIAREDPDLVLNCAAFSRVDRFEEDRDHALWVNRDRARNAVAQAARQTGALTVQISTDYVFDGRRRTPYRPADFLRRR